MIAALTLIATWPLALRLTDSLPGDYGDPVFVSWAIGWVSGTLTDALAQPTALGAIVGRQHLLSRAQTLAFSEHFIGQALIVCPFYWASGNLLLAYNVAFLSSFFLTGLGTFLLTRALIASAAGTLVAAVIATFNGTGSCGSSHTSMCSRFTGSRSRFLGCIATSRPMRDAISWVPARRSSR